MKDQNTHLTPSHAIHYDVLPCQRCKVSILITLVYIMYVTRRIKILTLHVLACDVRVNILTSGIHYDVLPEDQNTHLTPLTCDVR